MLLSECDSVKILAIIQWALSCVLWCGPIIHTFHSIASVSGMFTASCINTYHSHFGFVIFNVIINNV